MRRRRLFVLGLPNIARSGAAILGFCGIALLWLIVLHELSVERAQALQSAAQNTSNLSRAFEEHIVRSIKAVDQTLLFIRDSYEKDPDGFDISRWVQSTKPLTDLTFQISMIDSKGVMKSSNLRSGGSRVDLSDREHFRVHLDMSQDVLFISKPVMGRVSGKWSIQMTRKMITADGKFDGVVVMSIDPEYLSRFYDSVDLGTQGVVVLVGTDGIIRTRSRQAADEAAIGKSLAGNPLLAAYASRKSGTFTALSQIDGIRRIYSYHDVRGFPLILSVGTAEADVLKGYDENRRLYLGLASLLSIFLFVVICLVAVRENRLSRAREQLRVSETSHARKSQLLETTLEAISQGIIMVDAANRVQVCNERAIEKLGLPQSLMAQSPGFDEVLKWQWEQNEFGPDGNALEEGVRNFVKAGGLSNRPQVYERTRPNGMVLEVRSTPLPGGGIVRTYTDITRIKHNEINLRQARDQANEATRVKSEFLATMSHEIRSPMSGLLGVLELLSETGLDHEQQGMVRIMRQSALALLGVLNDILDFSKIEADALSIHTEPTCLTSLVTEVVQPYALEAARKSIDLTLECGSPIPELVQIDLLRLRQILNNLLGNAMKFTAAGKITLTFDIDRKDTASCLRFSIQDSGVGMDEDLLARLFEPFTQADGSTARNFGGTGLGLCISRRLARMLNGELTVTSERGKGSVFTLVLPLTAVCVSGATAEGKTLDFNHDDVNDDRIVLVVDDDPTSRWLIQRQLKLLGLNADVAEDGATGLAMLRTGRYLLLITDCHMPKMDGVALTHAVRSDSDPMLRDMPIVGLTADVTVGQRDRCQDAGMTDVAIKPVSRAQLSHLLALHLPASQVADWSGNEKILSDAQGTATFDTRIYFSIFPADDSEGQAWLLSFGELAEELNRNLDDMLARDEVPRDALAATAHRLVGSAFSVGAMRLGEGARVLERAAQSEDRKALCVLYRKLGVELARVRIAISKFLPEISLGATS